MSNGSPHKLSFEIDRLSGDSLTDQVADSLRRAIVGGQYPIGSTLPTLAEMASGLCVSLNVVRRAIDRLSKEGLLAARRGVGCVVKPNGTKLSLGRIVVLSPNIESYYSNMLTGRLREALSKLGYFVSMVSTPPRAGG